MEFTDKKEDAEALPDVDIDDVVVALRELNSELLLLRQRFEAHEHKVDGRIVLRF